MLPFFISLTFPPVTCSIVSRYNESMASCKAHSIYGSGEDPTESVSLPRSFSPPSPSPSPSLGSLSNIRLLVLYFALHFLWITVWELSASHRKCSSTMIIFPFSVQDVLVSHCVSAPGPTGMRSQTSTTCPPTTSRRCTWSTLKLALPTTWQLTSNSLQLTLTTGVKLMS